MIDTPRKLYKIGKSLCMTIPGPWIKAQQRKSGKKLTHVRITTRDNMLEVYPMFDQSEDLRTVPDEALSVQDLLNQSLIDEDDEREGEHD